ncbi:MAG TPA: DUF4197 domain-containing protein [Bacteroidales bacterium]|nr:DUF4197 domain-containing protein [Bacteroidales bacterium]
MRKILFLSFIIIVFGSSLNSNAQLLKGIKKVFSSKSTGLTEQDAASGIKEALIKGTSEGVQVVSKLDGYFGNPEIKIPLPSEANAMAKRLRSMGMGKQVDQAVLSLNRAAEDAAKEAKPIFVAAITNMTITDALNIVKGKDDAATQYLQKSTSPELNKKFQPIIKTSLDKVDATKYWTDLANIYNKIPFVTKINPNLTEYVTGKAIDGLFVMIAKEELKIRKDPVARTSEILRKVFGN